MDRHAPCPTCCRCSAATPDIVVGRLDPIGLFPQCRPNMLQGPTANTGVRQAMLAAVDQREVMQAVMGEDASAYRTGVGVFVPGMPGFTEAGLGRLGPKPDSVVRAMLDRAGYDGGKVVLLHPTDQPFYQRDVRRGGGGVQAGGHQPGRPVDGLGHGGAAPGE